MSSTTIAALAVAATIQIILLLVALRLWLTTPEDRFTLGRWQWLAIIVCLSMVGPIAFLVAGRAPAPVVEAPRASDIPRGEPSPFPGRDAACTVVRMSHRQIHSRLSHRRSIPQILLTALVLARPAWSPRLVRTT